MAEENKIVPNVFENMIKCLCPQCPAHNECMESNNERFFCSKGKAECNLEKIGCLCGTCPVKRAYGLTEFYYCDKGAAKR